jgi:predicted sulfurtransferase
VNGIASTSTSTTSTPPASTNDMTLTSTAMARTKGKKTSMFRGECFVFNKRVAVTAGIQQTKWYVSCHRCRGPMDRRLLLPPRSKLSCDCVVVGIVDHVNVSEEMVSDADGCDNNENA